MSKILKYLPIIGLIIFIILLYNIGILNVIEEFKKVNIIFIIISFFFMIPSIYLKGLKWNILTYTFSKKIKTVKYILFWLIGFHISLITPGKMGDLARGAYIAKEEKISIGKGLSTVIVDRVIDVVSIAIIAVLTTLLFFREYMSSIFFYYALLITLGLIAGTAIIFSKKATKKLLKPIYKFLIPKRIKEKFSIHFSEFYQGIGKLLKNKRKLTISTFLTFGAWIMVFLQYYFLSLALNLNLTFLFLAFMSSLMLILQILPISFSGIGVRDAIFIFLLGSAYSVIPSIAVSFSLLILFSDYMLSIPGWFLWAKNPISLK